MSGDKQVAASLEKLIKVVPKNQEVTEKNFAQRFSGQRGQE